MGQRKGGGKTTQKREVIGSTAGESFTVGTKEP